MRKTFAVGKITGKTGLVLLVEEAPVPARGPWRLRTLARPLPAEEPRRPPLFPGTAAVH